MIHGKNGCHETPAKIMGAMSHSTILVSVPYQSVLYWRSSTQCEYIASHKITNLLLLVCWCLKDYSIIIFLAVCLGKSKVILKFLM